MLARKNHSVPHLCFLPNWKNMPWMPESCLVRLQFQFVFFLVCFFFENFNDSQRNKRKYFTTFLILLLISFGVFNFSQPLTISHPHFIKVSLVACFCLGSRIFFSVSCHSEFIMFNGFCSSSYFLFLVLSSLRKKNSQPKHKRSKAVRSRWNKKSIVINENIMYVLGTYRNFIMSPPAGACVKARSVRLLLVRLYVTR